MVTADSFRAGQERLNRARTALQLATDDLSVDAESGPYAASPGATVAACRRAITHAAAAVFVLHEVPVPEGPAPDVHGDAARELFETVESAFPGRFDGRKTARLLLLADLWAGAHPASDEGVTVAAGAVAPDDLFAASDAEAALEHATEAKRIATRHMDRAGRDVYGRD